MSMTILQAGLTPPITTCCSLLSGIKTFEIHKNDRDFNWRYFELREWIRMVSFEKDKGIYTGAVHWKVITYFRTMKISTRWLCVPCRFPDSRAGGGWMDKIKPLSRFAVEAKITARDVEPQGDPWYGKNIQTFVICTNCGACLFDDYFHGEGFADEHKKPLPPHGTSRSTPANGAWGSGG